jgi:hypothetical protein
LLQKTKKHFRSNGFQASTLGKDDSNAHSVGGEVKSCSVWTGDDIGVGLGLGGRGLQISTKVQVPLMCDIIPKLTLQHAVTEAFDSNGGKANENHCLSHTQDVNETTMLTVGHCVSNVKFVTAYFAIEEEDMIFTRCRRWS